MVELSELEIAEWFDSRVTETILTELNKTKLKVLDGVINSQINRNENCGIVKGIDASINIILSLKKRR